MHALCAVKRGRETNSEASKTDNPMSHGVTANWHFESVPDSFTYTLPANEEEEILSEWEKVSLHTLHSV